MKITTSLRFLQWFIIAIAIWVGSALGFAQTKAAQPSKPTVQPPTGQIQRWQGGQRTITDAAGRPHVRGERITYAQRKAVAQQRIKAIREAAAKRKLAEVTK